MLILPTIPTSYRLSNCSVLTWPRRRLLLVVATVAIEQKLQNGVAGPMAPGPCAMHVAYTTPSWPVRWGRIRRPRWGPTWSPRLLWGLHRQAVIDYVLLIFILNFFYLVFFHHFRSVDCFDTIMALKKGFGGIREVPRRSLRFRYQLSFLPFFLFYYYPWWHSFSYLAHYYYLLLIHEHDTADYYYFVACLGILGNCWFCGF